MAVTQNVKQGIYWKVGGLLPGASSLHVSVSLGETLNPELCPMHSLKCECYTGCLDIKKPLYDWVDEAYSKKHFEWLIRNEKHFISTSPFTSY